MTDNTSNTTEESNANAATTTESATPRLVTDGGKDDAKVVGHNTDEDGESYGVWGEVESVHGYGLYTPDNVKVEGRIETDEIDTRGESFQIRAGNWSTEEAMNLFFGHRSNGGLFTTGAVIGGGGYDDGDVNDANVVTGFFPTISGGRGNEIIGFSDYSTIGGGRDNHIGDDDQTYCTIGGGENNTIESEGADHATIGGGENNTASGEYATINGGVENRATADETTIAGGNENKAEDVGATVCGGRENDSDGRRAFVGGGLRNKALRNYSTVSGGLRNVASGRYATVPGGIDNVAFGDYSFAAGRRAEAKHDGTFVWADSSGTFESTEEDQFLVEASNGVGIGTNEPHPQFAVEITKENPTDEEGNLLLGEPEEDVGFGLAAATFGDDNDDPILRFHPLHSIDEEDPWFRSWIEDDGTYQDWSVFSASWIDGDGAFHSQSDSRLKRDVQQLDSILDDVCSLKPSTYHWKYEDDTDERHYGLIAQDVEEYFPELVEDVGGQLGLDYSKLGVLAVQAIQEQQEQIDAQGESLEELTTHRVTQLETEVADLTEELETKDDRIAELEARNEELERRLGALESAVGVTEEASAAD